MKSIEKINKIINSNLCNKCGTCVGLSEGKIVFSEKTGKYLPSILEEPDKDLAYKIWNACSGKGFDFPKQRNRIYGPDINFHTYLGHFEQIYIGYSEDPKIRKYSASGGILSSILIWLLEHKKIDGAVVLGMSEKEPWLTQPFIATSRKEIISAAQSKYIISSTNEILPDIAKFNGKLAYVGLPGQVQAIRLLQEANDPMVDNIKYIFGPFYGNTLHFSSIKSFLRSYGIKDHTEIRKLYFRYGEWPGKMHIELENGKIIEMSKFHANYLIPFHILKNSLLCTDLTNEYTDVSGGDAWAPVYEERGKGYSLVISRSKEGEEILQEMARNNLIKLKPITIDEAITMHSHGYDLKKRGTFIRMRFRKAFGLKVPDYGYVIKGFSFKRYLMEIIIDFLFLVFNTKFARFIVEKLPPSLIGNVFEKTRTIWKRSTHKIKRQNLN